MLQVIIIGGGAAGLMAAIQAARSGARVTILEQNDRPGKKILATGNGRCNITNLFQEPACYHCSDPEFPWKIVQQFPVSETIRFFSQIGVYTRNRNGWMYPYCDQASSVAKLLELEARNRKVKIKTRETVKNIRKTPEGFQVETGSWTYSCHRVVVTCGGKASSVEGSNGSGYQLAENLGHSIHSPLPALVPLRCKGGYFPRWAGVRMEGIVSLEIQGHIWKRERGELMFTDYGISGIPVFQLSRYAVRAKKEGCSVFCHLDLMPDFTLQELTRLLEMRRESCPCHSVPQVLLGLIPEKLIPLAASESSSLQDVAAALKNWKLEVKGAHSFQQAQVCSGGVDTGELTSHMESRLIPGLYFAGELVDVDGPCGGYNLQWAWSSGTVAGRAAAEGVKND